LRARLRGQAQQLRPRLSRDGAPGRKRPPGLPVRHPPVGDDEDLAVHAEVGVQDDAAGEVDEQVLADRLGLLERPALQLGRAAVKRRARVRRLRQPDLAAAEGGVEPGRSPVDRVALGH
jgi:hypothetical protein